MNTVTQQEFALEQFTNGLNCSQSVLSSFAENTAFSRIDLERIAAAFDGGIGEGETCGAVTGALMVLGLKYGHTHSTIGNKEVINQASTEFKEKFIKHFGSLNCKDLLGVNISQEDGHRTALESGVFETKCPEFIKDAIAIINTISK
jgi:C_GCAxxG_C_C family probable redox protein